MKRLVTVFLAVLILSGCGKSSGQSTHTTFNSASMNVSSRQSFYQPDSPVERATAGAVHVYDMGKAIHSMNSLDGQLLICTEGTALSLLDSKTLEILKERNLETDLTRDYTDFVVNDKQVGFYNHQSNSYTILNSELITESTLEIPDVPTTAPVISADFKTIYYATEDGIRTLNVSTGTSRILRQEYTRILSLESVLFDNEILHYTREDSNGAVQNCYINAQDGSTCQTSLYGNTLIQWDDRYAGIDTLYHPLGTFQQIITGVQGEPPQVLSPRNKWTSAFFPGSSQVVTQLENQIGITLNCYDLITGKMTAEIILPQLHDLFTGGCIQGNYLWMWNDSDSKFYCWNMSLSAPRENICVLSDFNSLNDPRDIALASFNQRVSSLGNQYGIKISFIDGENRTQGYDYSLTPDYRADLYDQALTTLNMALQRMPSGFLEQVGKRTYRGNMHITLIDQFDPALKMKPGTAFTQFEDGNVMISLEICPEIEQLFYLQLGYAIDARISSMSDEVKDWTSLNPTGFTYSNLIDKDTPYLTEKHNYFTDYDGMISARDDRARIFLYALLPDQGKLFESSHMQAKLSMLCRLIRSTYTLEPNSFLPWEQYLK